MGWVESGGSRSSAELAFKLYGLPYDRLFLGEAIRRQTSHLRLVCHDLGIWVLDLQLHPQTFISGNQSNLTYTPLYNERHGVLQSMPREISSLQSTKTAKDACSGTFEDPEKERVVLLPIGKRIFSTFQALVNFNNAKSAAFRGHLVTESERFTLWAQSQGLS